MQAFDVLSNMVYAPLKISSPEDGVERISGIEGIPEIIYIFLDFIAPENYHKKEYYHIQRFPIPSRLDEWIYENLVQHEEYARYLDRCRGKKDIDSDNIDPYILKQYYYPTALRILKKKRNFNPAVWSKPRYQFSYERRSNLFLKNAQEIRFDFRNTIEIFFTVKLREERSILAVGGSGGSSQRESNTLFTAVYYLLGKKKPLRHHLIKYDGHNEFEYLRSYRKVLLTNGFGSNYDLDKGLMLEIRRAGINAYRIPEIKKSG